MDSDRVVLYEDQRIRTAWNEAEEEWYFSVVDVIGILTEQSTPRSASTYWAVLARAGRQGTYRRNHRSGTDH